MRKNPYRRTGNGKCPGILKRPAVVESFKKLIADGVYQEELYSDLRDLVIVLQLKCALHPISCCDRITHKGGYSRNAKEELFKLCRLLQYAC